MLSDHPPAEYPKLYPVPEQQVTQALKSFQRLNAVLVLVGCSLLLPLLLDSSSELFGWDNQAGLVIYFLMQYLPFVYLASRGIKHHQMMRQLNQDGRRSASLVPRKILHYVSPVWLILIATSLVIYAMTVYWVAQDPFTGFAGYWNLLFVLALSLFFWVMIQIHIKGRRSDPHLSDQDRWKQQQMTVQLLVKGWLLAVLFLTGNLWLAHADLRTWSLAFQSLYFTSIALLMSLTTIQQPSDFSVYRADSATSTTPTH